MIEEPRGRSELAGTPTSPETQGKALAELGRISAELLHDLGGVLSVLEGRVAVARAEASQGRSSSPELMRIQRETRELRTMVLDILDEMRGASRSPDMAVPVEPLLDEAVNRWLPGAPRVTPVLEMFLPPGARIPGPRTFFTRAVGNLLRNAGRHASSQIRILARTTDGDSMLEVVVEDDGAGIDPSVAARMFDPFIAGEGQGSGLGLSFARWAAERLGGSLESGARGRLGGAAFRLRVPLAEPSGTRSSGRRGVSGQRAVLRGIRVAVVDDDTAVRHVLGRRLRGEGAAILTPSIPSPEDIDSLLALLRSWNPDIVLMDIHMGATSGLALQETLSRRWPQLGARVLLLTGGEAPMPPPRVPVINKLVEWDELVGHILDTVKRTGGKRS